MLTYHTAKATIKATTKAIMRLGIMVKVRTDVAAAVVEVVEVVEVKNNMSHILQLTVFLLILVLLLVGLGIVQIFFPAIAPFKLGTTRTESVPTPIINAVRAGDFNAALTERSAVQNNPNATAQEKAVATYNAIGSQFRTTGENAAILEEIRSMKGIITDEAVSLATRVNTLNVFSSQYSISGRDPEVFAEMYKDEPFSTYLVPNDPDQSARKLAEWSYSLMPTSLAAINIARWYTEQVVVNPDQSPETTQEYATIAEDFLKKAEAASVEEAKRSATYSDSSRYLLFRYWRTMVISRLALQIGEPYRSQVRTTFDEFITFAQSQRNVLAKDQLSYARFFYAQRLFQLEDTVAGQIQLDLLAREMETVQNPKTSPFMRFLFREFTYRPEGANWVLVTELAKVSPSFRVAVEEVFKKMQE